MANETSELIADDKRDKHASSPVNSAYVQRQVELIQEGLTKVLFGDYTAVIRTEGRDPIWGNLAMHVNVVINAARNAIARAEKSEVLAAMKEELEERNFELQVALQEVEGRTVELEAANKEITEKQAQLLQSSKLAAVGQLAAGIAHEINNPLTTILGFAEFLDRSLEKIGPVQLAIDSIVRESRRARDLIGDLLVFSRSSEAGFESIDLGDILDRVLKLCSNRARLQSIELELSGETTIPRINGDPRQIEQVLLNLLNNALDAVEFDGKISVEVYLEEHAVIIHVFDSGPGIPDHVLDRLFEPFFTTKPPGSGTGLGLALCYDIIVAHGGRIGVTNRPEGGACFTVRLPLQDHVR